MYRLLIVDDEINSRVGLSKLNWTEHDLELVALAENGVKAYQYITENPVDIVITDIKMPFMNGIELSARLHEEYPDIIVIVLSGYDDFAFVKQCLRNDVFDYLLKPLNYLELQETLKNATQALSKVSMSQFSNIDNVTNNHIVKLCINYIREHFREDITLDDIAIYTHTSRSYISRIFKQNMGVGLSEYLAKVRVNEAKTMLKQSIYKINEIADILGFGSARYFSQIFKKHTGMTPYDYRNNGCMEKGEQSI